MYRLEKFWNKLVYNSWYKCDWYISSDNPIIVGGSARSGTTLLRVILDSHKNLYCGPESSIFCSDDNRNQRRIANLAFKFGIPKKKIRNILNESRCETEFIEMFFNYLLFLNKKKRWVDKTPKNVRNISNIFDKFPKAKFVHMIRDGRDTACSLKRHPKNKLVNGTLVPLNTNKPLNICIERWAKDVRLGLNWKDDPRYFEIRYEDLIFNSEKELSKLFIFLDEPFSNTLLSYHEKNLNPMSFITSPDAIKPISQKSYGRWRKEFSNYDKVLFKQIAGDLLIKLGYEKDSYW